MKPPAFQFYPDDFLGGTMHFTDAEVGLYIRLLCVQWSTGSLPNDDAELLSYGKDGTAITKKVRSKFQLCDDGKLRNARLEEVRGKQAEFRANRSQAGKEGARQRWHSHSTANGSAITQPMANDGSPVSVLRSPSPNTNQAAPPPVFPETLLTPAFQKSWVEWLAYRLERHLPVYKPRSLTKQLQELASWGEPAAIASIDVSIRQQWQGLFPPDPTRLSNGTHPKPNSRSYQQTADYSDVEAVMQRKLAAQAERDRPQSPPSG